MCHRNSPQEVYHRQSAEYPLGSVVPAGKAQGTDAYSPSQCRGTKGVPDQSAGQRQGQKQCIISTRSNIQTRRSFHRSSPALLFPCDSGKNPRKKKIKNTTCLDELHPINAAATATTATSDHMTRRVKEPTPPRLDNERIRA